MSEYYTLGSWQSTGVPDYLEGIDSVDPATIRRIINELPETKSVPIYHPNYLSNTGPRNLIIQSSDSNFTGADVYITFLYEGAGYSNVLGYYVYPLNNGHKVPTKLVNGSYVPMTYSDKDTLGSNGKSILKKTIVFPNCSLPKGYWTQLNAQAGGGNLYPGSKVKLVYDTSNPSLPFPNNTGIGFFLIPNGWNKTSKTFTNANPRIYSDNVFNTNSYQQTILLNDEFNSTNSMGSIVISFEDIMKPGGDQDFNDVVIQVSFTPRSAVNLDDSLILPGLDPITENVLICDNTGCYVRMKDSTITTLNNTPGDTIIITHQINTNDADYCYKLKTVLESFTFVYDVVINSIDDLAFTVEISFPKTNVQNYIYFFLSYANVYLASPISGNSSALASFQDLYLRSRQYITSESLNCSVYDSSDDSDTVLIDNPNVTPLTITTSPYAMGDPHITTIYNKYYTIPNDLGIIRMFSDGEFIINAELNYYPPNDKYPAYKDLTFMKYLGIRHNDKHIVVDMFNPDTYYKIIDEQMVKIEPQSEEIFKIIPVNEMPKKILQERLDRFNKLAKKHKYELRYLEFNTMLLGKVYVELMFSFEWRDFINSINLISNGLCMTNGKGALVRQSQAKLVSSLI